MAIASTLPAIACGARESAKPPAALDTVEVTAKPDAAASLATDAVAKPVGASGAMAGALPEDFPRDVPLPQPSSLVDFSERSVTFEIAASPDTARDDYARRLRAAGFAAEPGGRWRRGERRLAVVARPAGGGATQLVIEILPGG